jgi:alpha-1,2-mannosyltransferase
MIITLSLLTLSATLFIITVATPLLLPYTIGLLARFIGYRLKRSSQDRRDSLWERVKANQEGEDDEEWEHVDPPPGYTSTSKATRLTRSRNPFKRQSSSKKSEHQWKGIIGFFHPFCAAGGGGERVLWAAIHDTQMTYPNALCVVYTGDHSVDKQTMLGKVRSRFNITLRSSHTEFLYLTTRPWVLASSWPRFTLAGQSFGSIVLAGDAFTLLVPDIFLDTMGYAYALWFSKLLFPSMKTAAYVHYPTISTDMLDSLQPGGQGVNGGAGSGVFGAIKKQYWQLFAWSYGFAGKNIDLVFANSSWTAEHIRKLWGPKRLGNSALQKGLKKYNDGKGGDGIEVLFPPVPVQEMSAQIDVTESSEERRNQNIIYVAQFRPEKNHELILQAFADLVRPPQARRTPQTGDEQPPPYSGFPDAKLTLLGSIRDAEDSTRVYKLRILAQELHITENVDFVLDAPFSSVLDHLQNSSIGTNGMWNEHFGIGIVEYQASGLIAVVHDSGGAGHDIVVDGTGFRATDRESYRKAFEKAFSLTRQERVKMRKRATENAKRFGEDVFERGWRKGLEYLVQ